MVNRSRMEMSRIIFQRLINHAKASDTLVMNADKGRYIKRYSDPDAELMAKAAVRDKRTITRQMRAVMFEYNERRYYAFFGFTFSCGVPSRMPEGLTELDATPGLFAIAVTETDVIVRATPAEIRDIIEEEYIGHDHYIGHDLNDVANLFPSAIFVEADTNYDYTEDIDRVIGAMVAATYIDGPIAFDKDTLGAAGALFTSGSKFIPFDKALQGILSISWSGFYIELYRCIEQLYPVPRLVDLLQEWSSSQSFCDLANLLQTRLGWRPREDESLIKLIAACSESIASNLIAAFDIQFDEKSTPSEIAGRQVYAMRNGLVHFRNNHGIPPLSDERWNAIIVAMIALVTAAYTEFGLKYHQGS